MDTIATSKSKQVGYFIAEQGRTGKLKVSRCENNNSPHTHVHYLLFFMHSAHYAGNQTKQDIIILTTMAGIEDKVIKVLSWNIYGKEEPNLADVRKQLVPLMVQEVNPDIMLLQETMQLKLVAKEIINFTARNTGTEVIPIYRQVKAGEPTESQILFTFF